MSQSDALVLEDLQTRTDEELVRQAQQGSLEAFTALYKRYLPVVFNRVRYRVPEADVEDVTQEVFITLLRSLGSFRSRSAFSTWLRTLTNRRIADYYRRRRETDSRSGAEPDEGHDPGADAGANANGSLTDTRIMLQRALNALPEHYQEVILLRFAEGLSFEEIAIQRGQSLEATKSLFRRAIAALREQMEE